MLLQPFCGRHPTAAHSAVASAILTSLALTCAPHRVQYDYFSSVLSLDSNFNLLTALKAAGVNPSNSVRYTGESQW